jgi:cation-transporting ATPase 13A1
LSQRCARARCRVIALAYKKLDEKLSPVEISNLPREDIESDLEFGAFAIFQCPLKEESEPALRMLKVAPALPI